MHKQTAERRLPQVAKIVHNEGSPDMELPVLSPEKYDGKFPSFREPTEIGSYSLDGSRDFHPDKRQLKYIVMPAAISGLKMDLSKGYNEAITKDFGKTEKLNSMLQWVVSNPDKVAEQFAKKSTDTSTSGQPDFLCYRGLLTTLVCTPYENKDDWLICATKFKGTIYLCAFDTEKDKERMRKQTPREKLMSSWGYKFEQYMTADTKDGEPDIESPVNQMEEYNIVVKGRLNNCSILYGAEMDGVDKKHQRTDNSPIRYLELKTSRQITSEKQDWNFCRFKLIKWWAQSFLIGIPKIICGFRDDDGFVNNLRTFRTSDIPKMAEGLWSPAAGMTFCATFLDFVKNCVVKDHPYIVYKFYWKPGQNITCSELSSPSEYQILPDWYISAFEANTGK